MTERRRATEAEVSALASGIRLRIIRLTYVDALTNKELAERLGRDPATTLHHVRKLVDTGFLAPQPERRGNRGAKEIPYLSTGLSWYLDTGSDGGTAEAMLEAFLGEVADTGVAELDQTRLVVRLPPEQVDELKTRLAELLEEYLDRPAGPEDEQTAIYLALYPGGRINRSVVPANRGTMEGR